MRRLPFASIAMRPVIVLLLASALAAPSLHAQVGYDAPKARVEVMGLKHWTLQMLRDSVRHYVPGQDLHDAACMATLREKLGFADALVNHYMGMTGPGSEFLLIKVVEPQERGRVRWNTVPRDSLQSLRSDYAPLVLPVTDTSGHVWTGRFMNYLQYGDSTRRIMAAQRMMKQYRQPTAPADAQRLNAFLRTQQSDSARRLALRALGRDGFWVNRMSAAVVLSNFGARDSTWHALVHALRDPNENVHAAAMSVLWGMTPRPVDWRPAVEDLRAVLGGTNVASVGQVFTILVRTKVAPELASALLHDNADWLLDHLGSEAPMVAGDARALLVRLNRGTDLGPSRAAWEAWAKAL
jgi:hypothetical protein